MGGNWINNISVKAKPFWVNVFNAWKEFCQKQQSTSNTDVVYSSLWFNGHISKKPLFFSKLGKTRNIYSTRCDR